MKVSLRYIIPQLKLIKEYNKWDCKHGVEVMGAMPHALVKTCLEATGSALCLDEQLSRCHSQVGCIMNEILDQGCVSHPCSNPMTFYQLS